MGGDGLFPGTYLAKLLLSRYKLEIPKKRPKNPFYSAHSIDHPILIHVHSLLTLLYFVVWQGHRSEITVRKLNIHPLTT